MNNRGIVSYRQKPIRRKFCSAKHFPSAIFPIISGFAALTSPNGHLSAQADTIIIHYSLFIIHYSLLVERSPTNFSPDDRNVSYYNSIPPFSSI